MSDVEQFRFTTGPAQLPGIGSLSYNGCSFSPLVVTDVSGKVVKDNALRTTKLMEYKLTVDGYVTLNDGARDISSSVNTMRLLLTQQGGKLTYSGRGFELLPLTLEVAWGPVPELVEFQPLGGGLSAKVKWEVTFRACEVTKGTHLPTGGDGAQNFPLLQFNYETSLTYGEDYYSSLSVKGTMEILMNRTLNTAADGRTLTATVDSIRTELDRRIFSGIDLSRFYPTRRNYNVSRDKRTMEFDVLVEEKPYMDMPPNCSIARGSYNVRPAKSGPGLVLWMCTLRASYTVVANSPRRVAWIEFLRLLQLRMSLSRLANIPAAPAPAREPQNPADVPWWQQGLGTAADIVIAPVTVPVRVAADLLGQQNRDLLRNNPVRPGAWLIDFSFDEGLYKDSKVITFSATWRMVTTLSHILLASGVWTKVQETTRPRGGENLWAISMASFSGALGVLPNYLKPSSDIIIDFGY